MDSISGLLKLEIRRGINLAVRDALTSDPYVLVTLGEQQFKTRVVNSNCNPVWNEELTFSVTNPNTPIKIIVYDYDTWSADDDMGEAEFSIMPLLECIKLELEWLPNGTTVGRVYPTTKNGLADESCVVWNDGIMTQEMIFKLKKVECGELEINIELIDLKF